MKRIGMMLAVGVGGVLLTMGEAKACESHRARADAPSAVTPGPEEKAAPARTAPAKADEADELHAAKCQCASAADCTCKRGTCECPKCKKPRRDAVPPPEAEG
jgi:hypothetical protein